MHGCTCQTQSSIRVRWLPFCFWALFASLCAAPNLRGQTPPEEDRPAVYVPLQPPTKTERNRRESLHQYVLGLLLERADQLLEALKVYEDAARLDPEAAAVFKAQVPILLTLGREKESLAAIGKVLDLDSDDHDMWFIAGRLHKALGRDKEARDALQRGLQTPGIQEHPDVAQQMYLELATMCEQADDVPRALHALTLAAKILDHPDALLEYGPFNRDMILTRASETHERIGHLYRKQKKYDEAIDAYKQAQAANPERAGRINFNLAQLLAELRRHEQALVYLDAYLRFQPMGLEAYEMKIAVLQKLSRVEGIVPWLEQAARTDPNNVGLKTLLAKQYAQSRQYNQAEQLFQALADESPNPEVYRGLFHLYLVQPERGMARALHNLDQAIVAATNPKGPPGLAGRKAAAMIAAVRDDGALAKELVRAAYGEVDRVPSLQFDTVQILAALADKNQQLVEAETFFRKGLKDAGPSKEALVYGGLLRVLWKEQKYDDVVQVCRQGLKNAHNPVLFHTEIALAQARLGKFDAALQATTRALQFAGENDKLKVRSLRVRVLAQADKYAEAEKECQAMLNDYTGPGDVVEIRYLLSNVFSASRQLAKAEQQLEIILKADPTNATVNNDLGYIWADQNKSLDKAEEMIRHAIELDRRQRQLSRHASAEGDQDNAAFIDSLGWVLFRRGQLDEACRQLQRASSLPDGADDPTVWDHLGDVYFRLQRVAEAKTSWERSAYLFETEKRRKMDERYQEVRRKLKAVE
jgi:tetratricopeptide (TPR) repeat protein